MGRALDGRPNVCLARGGGRSRDQGRTKQLSNKCESLVAKIVEHKKTVRINEKHDNRCYKMTLPTQQVTQDTIYEGLQK